MDSIYNADELVPPTWMNSEFFETVLKTAKNGDIQKICDYNVGPATVKGDHYASVMFRGVVKYLDLKNVKQEISLIIKTMPQVEGVKMDLLNESTIFEVEIEMFRDVIPKYHEILKSIGDNTILSANMLYYSLSPRKIIVLEDLKIKGYTTVGQRMGTAEETKMALESLAKWHACSYMLNQETEGSLEEFTNGVYNMPGTETNPVFYKGTERLVQIAKITPKLHKYVEKLEKIQDMVYKKCQNVYNLCKKKGRINVLTHGDFHVKNLMFHFNPETKIPENLILCDFQLCVWGSMALDLLYFTYMMIDGRLRDQYRDELIYEFFEKFRNTLKSLGYKGNLPKFSDLQHDMMLLCRIELFLATTFLPFMVSLAENPNIDPDTIMTNEETQLELYKSKRFIDEIEVILKRFLHQGFLDSIFEDDE